MRIYRSVCTYIWNDDKFPFSSDDCQLVWFHMFTHPASTPLGILRASIAGLAEDKNRNNGGWTLARYTKAFEEALSHGFVKVDRKALLISFPKYFSPSNICNHPQSPNVLTNWGKRFHDLPSSPLKTECYQSLKALLEGFGEGFRKAFSKAFGEGSPNTDSLFLIPEPEPEEKTLAPLALSVSDVMLVWNSTPGVKEAKSITGPIKKAVESRIREHPDMQWFKDLFQRVSQSNFLTGRSTDFTATLDWVLGPKNLAKILNGNYDDKKDQLQKKRPAFEMMKGQVFD